MTDGADAMPNPQAAPRTWRPWLWCLAAIPAIVPWYVFTHYHVDIVWNDAWDFAEILVRSHQGLLRFSDFWVAHNEHRIPVPYLIMFVLARLTHWNTLAESLFGYAMVWVLSLLLAMLLKNSAGDRNGRWRVGYWFLLNMLIFSPIQCENWVFGFAACADFLPVPCIVAAMLLLDRRGLKWSTLFLSAALIEIASLSLANGLVGWVLILLLLPTLPTARLTDRKHWFIVAWIGMILAGLVIQFWGYHSYAWADKYYKSSLLDRILFFLAFIGNPLAPGLFRFIVPIGFVLTLIFVLEVIRTLLVWIGGDRQSARRAIPWLLLGSYAIAGALLGAIGRAGLGPDQAETTRYTTISMCLLICFVGLMHVWQFDPSRRYGPMAKLRALSPLPFSAILIVALALGAYRSRSLYFRQMYICRAAMAHISFIDQLLEPHGKRLIGEYEDLRQRADALSAAGYLQTRLIENSDISSLMPPGAQAASGYGEINRVRAIDGGVLEIMGWAVLRSEHRGADVSLVTYDDENNVPRLCAIGNVELTIKEVATALGEEFERSGWVAQVPLSRLPAGARNLRCWGYDAEKQLAYPLAGQSQ